MSTLVSDQRTNTDMTLCSGHYRSSRPAETSRISDSIYVLQVQGEHESVAARRIRALWGRLSVPCTSAHIPSNSLPSGTNKRDRGADSSAVGNVVHGDRYTIVYQPSHQECDVLFVVLSTAE